MKISVSIRDMVEFVYRNGSIDSGYISGSRAADGIRIHKRIQAMRRKEAQLSGLNYEAEYSLKLSFKYKEYEFSASGRADGVIISADKISIEEIKSTAKDVNDIACDFCHWHFAQAKCYGYMYCADKGVDCATINLTYCNIESGEYKTFSCDYLFEELKGFFFSTVELYYAFADMDYKRILRRNGTADSLAFPYPNYRKGQRELAVSVYAAISNSKKLFAHAPTGIGKTASTLYPALKALGKGLITKIFYLTSRTTNALAAVNCLKLMEENGLDMVSLKITAKASCCFLDEPKCSPAHCEYANGHFDRVNQAIIDIVTNERIIEREILEAYALKHKVCPYEMSLDVSLFCDTIICDYNYVYDGSAKLKRYFTEGMKNDFAVLADEAHNLVDRARQMYSARITAGEMGIVSAVFKNKKSGLKTAANKIKRIISALDKSAGEGAAVYEKFPDELFYALNDFVLEADKWLAVNESSQGFDDIIDIYFNVLDFLKAYDYYDERYVSVISGSGKDTAGSLMCVDPSFRLGLCNKTVRSVTYFSATLNHMEFFTDVLGGCEDDYKIQLYSPFDRNNLNLIINSVISTKYRHRDATYGQISAAIGQTVKAHKGNYIIFFSSYAYMENVYNLFKLNYPDIRSACQVQGDKSGTFIDNYSEDNDETFAGFAVLGAGYSEGIDLTGDKLIGAIIVGVGFPMISFERNIIKDYYDRKLSKGYEYAYIYPGMNKVLQAAGRVIRKEDDRGVVLLIDTRYREDSYKSLFPAEWCGYKTAQNQRELSDVLNCFWGADNK